MARMRLRLVMLVVIVAVSVAFSPLMRVAHALATPNVAAQSEMHHGAGHAGHHADHDNSDTGTADNRLAKSCVAYHCPACVQLPCGFAAIGLKQSIPARGELPVLTLRALALLPPSPPPRA